MARAPRQVLDPSSLEMALATLQSRIDRLQQTLHEQQKLATLGMVTAVIAHEFNNILTPMISYTQYALSDKADDVLRTKALSKALSGAERMANISKSLLGFARGDESTTVNVKHALNETLACLSRDLSKDGITLSTNVPEELAVGMNGGQLQQVLMNLIVNARAAMLSPLVQGVRRAPKRLTVAAAVVREDRVEIRITDTGPGIPAEVLPRIFEPFFSTKTRPAGAVAEVAGAAELPAEVVPKGGTGLGLTICRELLQLAGGGIRVESTLGLGATFILELPLARSAETAVNPKP